MNKTVFRIEVNLYYYELTDCWTYQQIQTRPKEKRLLKTEDWEQQNRAQSRLLYLLISTRLANIEYCPRATTSSRDKYSGAKERKGCLRLKTGKDYDELQKTKLNKI